MNDQWTFQCEIQKRHPLRDETSTDETTPKPDRPRPHLGRNRVLAYGPVTFPHSGVSRMSASVRLMIQGHSARRASSRVRQCHQLIKISEIKSEAYTLALTSRPGRRPVCADVPRCRTPSDGARAVVSASRGCHPSPRLTRRGRRSRATRQPKRSRGALLSGRI